MPNSSDFLAMGVILTAATGISFGRKKHLGFPTPARHKLSQAKAPPVLCGLLDSLVIFYLQPVVYFLFSQDPLQYVVDKDLIMFAE